jgi:RNA polymerase sigma factor FliA
MDVLVSEGAPGRAGLDPRERERQIESHLGLVHHVARGVYHSCALDVDYDELVSAGTIGLMQALETYNPDKGAAFSTFAAPRIRGAIQDELRRLDHAPRSVRRKARDIARAREQLTKVLGRAPAEREIAEHLGVPLDTYHRWQMDAEVAFPVSLFGSTETDPQKPRLTPADVLAGADEFAIEDRLNGSEEAEYLREAILQLKEQERVVLALYYYEELKLHEIATVLGLTESRVSQIRSKALSRLREKLAPIRAAAR